MYHEVSGPSEINEKKGKTKANESWVRRRDKQLIQNMKNIYNYLKFWKTVWTHNMENEKTSTGMNLEK